MYLNYHKADPTVVDPNYQTQLAACFDLAAYIPDSEKVRVYSGKEFVDVIPSFESGKGNCILLLPGERALIRTGLTFDIPAGYSIRLHPRSGMALKFGLTLANCEGVVDEDYTHETKVIMMNTNTQEAIRIYDRDRIAQAEVVKYEQMKLMETYDRPEQKSDRIGGFGSTGRS